MKTDQGPFRALFPIALALLAIAMIAPGVSRAQGENETDEQHDEYVWPELRIYHVGDLPVFDRDRFQNPADVAEYLGDEFYAMNSRKLGPGLIAIYATPDLQAVFAEMMDSLRAARGEPVALRIAARRLDADDEVETVRVGRPAPAGLGELVLDHHQVVHRGLPAHVVSTTRTHYVAGLNPVVGSGAVAHSPQVDTVEGGLSLSVYAGEIRDGRTAVHIGGELTRVLMNEFRPDAIAAVASEASMQLPSIDRRSISSAITARDGEEIVFSIVQSPEMDGALLALTVTIRPLAP